MTLPSDPPSYPERTADNANKKSDDPLVSDMESLNLNNGPKQESISPYANIKHPLANSWTLWYYKNDRNKAWEDNIKEVPSQNHDYQLWSPNN